jgi:hypothetical protein
MNRENHDDEETQESEPSYIDQDSVEGRSDDVEERLREAKERGHGPIVLGAIESGIEIGDLRKDSEDDS